MRIKDLEIHGYRSFRDAVWRPGQLNLVVGPNGSGKSNLLRVLALISNAAKGNLAKSIAAAGGIVPLLWDHEPGTVGVRATFHASSKKDRPERTASYELVLEQVARGSGYKVKTDTLIFVNEENSEFGKGENSGYRLDADGKVLKRAFVNGVISDVRQERFDPNESLLAECKWDDVYAVARWGLHRDVEVGPSSSIRRPTTTQYLTRLENDGGNFAPVLHTLYTSNGKFRRAIDEGMRAGFGNEFDRIDFQPAASQQIQLAVQWKSSSEPHAGQDLSDGTLRFLFLLTVLAQPEPPTLIALEEPDIGLHPSMLSIIAEFAEAAAEKSQIVITTHSPDFLDCFSAKSPTVTLCNWESGRTRLYNLESENLATWLAKYRLGHMFTSGELDSIALADVEPMHDADIRNFSLPPEDSALVETADADANKPNMDVSDG